MYCFPAFCNLPVYLFKLLRVEKRAAKFFPDYKFDSLSISAERLCVRLFDTIVCKNDHPLRDIFEGRSPTPRNSCPLKAPFAKTTRFGKSFIRYGRPH